MLKAVLVDDEVHALESLSQQLALYHNNIQICACCDSIELAVEAIRVHQPDLVFLDVELGEKSGFDLFSYFPEQNFKVIFATGHRKYAADAFRFAALDYLLKPIQSELLDQAIRRVQASMSSEQFALRLSSLVHNMKTGSKRLKKIVLKTADSIHLVELNDILYCEADGGYTNFYFSDKSRIMVSNTLGDYEELFHEYDFFRIHQSFLLNLNHFKRYDKADGGRAILKNNISLPVATRKKDQLLQKLSELE